MKLFWAVTVLHLATCLPEDAYHPERQALFVKKDIIENGKRVARQTSADQMVQNILQWLQGVYTQNSRRIRQGTLREYLPPINTQKPRPFQPVTQGSLSVNIGGGVSDNNIIGGYPPAGSITPIPPFTNGGNNIPSIHPGIIPPVQIPNFNIPSSSQPPTGPPATVFTSSIGGTGFPSAGTDGYPLGPSTAYPAPSSPSTTTEFISRGGFPSSSTPVGVPEATTTTGAPTTTGVPTTFAAATTTTTSPAPTTISFGGPGYPTSSPRPFPTVAAETTTTTQSPSLSSVPDTEEPFTSNAQTTNQPTTTTPSEEENSIPSAGPHTTAPEDNKGDDTKPESTTIASRFGEPDDDLNHPPHIHAIDVQCSKEMMTIDIEFNREFDGIIYSKGHYNNPACRYVKENSGQKKYKITVSLNSCGTEFINAFDTEGKSYLENVLVLQNEPGIQEVWDTIRSVRCLWEGNLKKALNVALSVGMLRQEIVTFSGDTAMAKLDIQLGKGPFAPPANGLVKIGDVMTLVVSVTGDSGFDIQVKDCRATDSSGGNAVALTDDKGCVLKPKLFGAFQKTRNTGDTGASIIAYAFFNAFKFPDVMDLVMECNVDLCKTDCEMCPEPNQKIDPGRRRKRDLYSRNVTDDDSSVTIGRLVRVILPEDLNDAQALINLSNQNESICISTHGFMLSSALLISLLTSSCLFSAYIWLKYQRLNLKK